MTLIWAPQTRYTLRRNTASIIKDLVWDDQSLPYLKRYWSAAINRLPVPFLSSRNFQIILIIYGLKYRFLVGRNLENIQFSD